MKRQLKLKKMPGYSTINRRFSKVDIPVRAHSREPVVIAVDATGVKVTNSGEWLRKHYKKKRKRKGYIKLHIAVDVKSKKVLSVKVIDERKHDSTQMLPLMKYMGSKITKIDKVIADGVYDAKLLYSTIWINLA